MRFALKYIEEAKQRAKTIPTDFTTLDLLPNWNSILGLQIENLIYNNRGELLKAMSLSTSQIDLMIQTTEQSVYICEIKFQKRLDIKIIKEVERKISTLQKKEIGLTGQC